MKSVFIIIFSSIMLNCMAQKDLTISKVFYITLKSNSVSNYIAKDTTILIPEGKVWEITNAKVYMIYDSRIIGEKTYLYINDQIITYSSAKIVQNSDPLWLPAGKYRVTIRFIEESDTEGKFIHRAFLSGVEYDLE